MDFELSSVQKDIQNAAREFAEKEFTEVAREYDAREEFPTPIWKKACELGFVGTFIQEQYEGPGLGFTEAAIIMEEFWRVDPGCGNLILTAFGSEIIQKFGTEEQKKEYLPLLPSGRAIMCCAITEPDAGSDILLGSTSAVRDGGDYIINGSKIFITNGSVADLAVVFCATQPTSANRYKRHSFFLIERERPGFQAMKMKGKMGILRGNWWDWSFTCFVTRSATRPIRAAKIPREVIPRG